MDCEKFETTLIDELYDELDELTSAAAKRHVAGCARCASLLGGLKATRRVAVLPLVEPSLDLEERILAAAKDTQRVVPFRRRLEDAVSWAGSWAMRPQTAMAALFLLMVGTSAVLIRVRKQAPASATASMTITAEGSPAASAPIAAADEAKRMDPTVAAAAHGAPAPPPSPAAAATTTAAASALAANDPAEPSDIRSTAESSPLPPSSKAMAQPHAVYGPGYGGGSGASIDNGNPWADTQAQHARGGQTGGSLGREKSATAANPAFDAAMVQYKSGKFDDAARDFDAIRGDDTAALWAARSVRDGAGGCAQAIAKFDAIASRAFGTNAGYDATLEAGRCMQDQGSVEPARSRFVRLLTVPGYATRAQAAIDALSPSQQQQVATRRAPTKANKPATVQAAPARPPASPTASPPPQQATPQSPSAF